MNENAEDRPGDDRTRRFGDSPAGPAGPGPGHDRGYDPGADRGYERGYDQGADRGYGYPPDSPYGPSSSAHPPAPPPYDMGAPAGGYGYGHQPYDGYVPPGYGRQAPPGTYGPRPGSDDTTMALLAHLLGLLTSFVGPLVLYLAKKDESPYVRDQAAEALNFQLTVLVAYAVCWVLVFVLVGFVLMFLLWIGSLIMAIVAAVAAGRGENHRYPLTIRFVG